MALTADKLRDFYNGDLQKYPVKASSIIYKGSAVGEDAAGYVRALVAGDKFLGFAEEKIDNSAGAAGAMSVTVRRRGCVSLPVTSLAITDNDGVPVFASADDTFVKTASGNSFIGYVRSYESSGVGLVEYDATRTGAMTVGTASFGTLTAESSDARTISIQLKDMFGNDLAVRGAIHAYLSNDANGDTIEAASGTLSVAAGTDGALIELATDNCFLLVSESDGDIDVTITETGTNTVYVVLVLPDGRLVPSSAIAFA